MQKFPSNDNGLVEETQIRGTASLLQTKLTTKALKSRNQNKLKPKINKIRYWKKDSYAQPNAGKLGQVLTKCLSRLQMRTPLITFQDETITQATPLKFYRSALRSRFSISINFHLLASAVLSGRTAEDGVYLICMDFGPWRWHADERALIEPAQSRCNN